jgi:hypothetical protein
VPKVGGGDLFPNPFWNLALDERVFDKKAVGKGGVNLFEKGPVFWSAVEKMVADRDDDLGGEEACLFQRGLDETALVRTKIDNGCNRLLLHRRLAYHFQEI